MRDRRAVAICCLTESWHDAGSVSVGRIRTAGFTVVVDRPRQRAVVDLSSLSSLQPTMSCHVIDRRRATVNFRTAPCSNRRRACRVYRRYTVSTPIREEHVFTSDNEHSVL